MAGMNKHSDSFLYLCGGIAVVGIIVASYFAYQYREQRATIAALTQERTELVKTQNELRADLVVASTTNSELERELQDLVEDLEDLADDYRDERNRNEEFEDQIRGLAGTLGDLEKLESIDEELLAKYSKVYFLNENYIPERLKQIDDEYVLDGKGDQYFHSRAYDHLEDLMKAAERADVDLKIVSAYRSFDEQSAIKGQYTQVYGSGANAFSADQGYSEHQLGTTVDFSTTAMAGGLNQSFENTEAFAWLVDNAHKYGFILSYPEGNAFYIYEPWHWRFVSTELARDLDRRNDTFYELDQRDINEYLLEFFD